MTVPEMELGRYDVGWDRGLILLISKGSSPFFSPGCLYSTISDRSKFSKHYNNGIITRVELRLLPFIFRFRRMFTFHFFFFSRNGNGDNCSRMEETEAGEKHRRAVLLLLQTNCMLQNTQNSTRDIQWAPRVVLWCYGGEMRWTTWAAI